MLISSHAVVGEQTVMLAPVMKQKSFELQRKGGKFFKPTGKEDKWTMTILGYIILLCVGGGNRAADPNFGKKTASRFRSFETALSSLDLVYKLP